MPLHPIPFTLYSSDGNITATLNEILYAQNQLGHGYGSESTCEAVRAVVDLERRAVTSVGRIVVIVLAGVHLLKEIFQFLQVRGGGKLVKSGELFLSWLAMILDLPRREN